VSVSFNGVNVLNVNALDSEWDRIEWVRLVAILVAEMGLVADMSRVGVLVAKTGLKWP